MMKTALLLAASAALANAQVMYSNGTFVCNPEKPNGSFCVGESLTSNIILRCHEGIAQPGNCYDNLSGYPPQGGSARCWQSTPTAGDAACEKNCIVHAESGDFTLPGCGASTSSPPTTTITGTTYITKNYTTLTQTYTTTYCPTASLTTSTFTQPGGPTYTSTYIIPPFPTSSVSAPGNGTIPGGPGGPGSTPTPGSPNGPGSSPGAPGSSPSSATNTPPSPPNPSATPTPSIEFSGAQVAPKAFGLLAAAGLAAAVFL